MKINFIKKFLMLFALSAIIISCDPDEQTGFSVTTPSSPSVSIDLNFSNPTLVEDDSEFTYTVSISEAQVVDVKLHVSQIGGTADSQDYEMTHLISIPAGYTSANGSITILSDDIIEDTETLQIQIGSQTTANAALTPATAEFTILNYTDGDLVIDLAWAIPFTAETNSDNEGDEISATAFADLRLLISTTPDNLGIIGGADGGSFETAVLAGNTPDGTYYIVSDFYAANTEVFRDIDLSMELNQAGVINGDMYNYPAALNNAVQCSAAYFVLAQVVKTGDSYEVTSIGENQPPQDAEGDWELILLDAYGDGWDSAFITVTINGVSTNYTCTASQAIYTISVPAGATFSISYTAGSNWEEEHHLDLYDPNGYNTDWWGYYWTGYNIPEGLLYSNTNPCP